MLCTLNSLKPGHVVKEISYLKLKSIDFDSLRSDLEKSELCTRDFSNLCELTSSYNSTLSSLWRRRWSVGNAFPGLTVISREHLGRVEGLRETGVTLIPSRTFLLSRLQVITLRISWTVHVVITSLILSLRTVRTRESCFVQPIHCYLSRLMFRFQITYLSMIWLIILATI